MAEGPPGHGADAGEGGTRGGHEVVGRVRGHRDRAQELHDLCLAPPRLLCQVPLADVPDDRGEGERAGDGGAAERELDPDLMAVTVERLDLDGVPTEQWRVCGAHAPAAHRVRVAVPLRDDDGQRPAEDLVALPPEEQLCRPVPGRDPPLPVGPHEGIDVGLSADCLALMPVTA